MMMIKAAGACILAKDTQRILLQHRSLKSSYARNWAFWGGKIEDNENVSQGLLRELEEEIGIDVEEYVRKVYPLDQYHARDKTFSYYTFVVLIDKEFTPIINDESGGYAWVNSNYFPKPLHPGAQRTLFKKKKLNILKSIINSL
jgi:mutator protein MutT